MKLPFVLFAAVLLSGCNRQEPAPTPPSRTLAEIMRDNADYSPGRFQLSEATAGLRLFDTATGDLWTMPPNSTNWQRIPNPTLSARP